MKKRLLAVTLSVLMEVQHWQDVEALPKREMMTVQNFPQKMRTKIWIIHMVKEKLSIPMSRLPIL